jgi:hypothetical protein
MALDPSVKGDVDIRKSFRDAFGAIPGNRSDWLLDEREADAIRQRMQEAMAQQQQLQQLGAGADVAGRAGVAAQEVQAALNG